MQNSLKPHKVRVQNTPCQFEGAPTRVPRVTAPSSQICGPQTSEDPTSRQSVTQKAVERQLQPSSGEDHFDCQYIADLLDRLRLYREAEVGLLEGTNDSSLEKLKLLFPWESARLSNFLAPALMLLELRLAALKQVGKQLSYYHKRKERLARRKLRRNRTILQAKQDSFPDELVRFGQPKDKPKRVEAVFQREVIEETLPRGYYSTAWLDLCGAPSLLGMENERAYFELYRTTNIGIEYYSDLAILLNKLATDAKWSYHRWHALYDEILARTAKAKLPREDSVSPIPFDAFLGEQKFLLSQIDRLMVGESFCVECFRLIGHGTTDHLDRMHHYELVSYAHLRDDF